MSIINEFPAYYKGITNDVGIDATVANFTGLSDGVVKCTSGTLSGASTTTDLPEGVNQYYTSVRATADARAALSAGTGISYNSSTGVITNTGSSSITGTANQVLANGTSGTPQSGAVTLTLPQSIATTSPVRFGSVAVGTTSSYPLHIASGNGYMLCDLSSTYAAEYVGVNSGGAELRVYGDSSGNAHIGTITNHDLAFRTNDVNKMWLSKDGYLGIGVSPTVGVYLDVYSNMYLRDANAGFKIATSLGTNYIESAGAGMAGAADLRFTDMNAANTWMTIKSDGKLGVGTASPATAVHIQTSGTTTNQILTIENAVTSSAGQPTVLTKKSRGTISAPTTLVNGDTIGAFTVQGHDGSNYISAASISAQADSTVGTNSMPTALVFRTTPSGGVSTVENMRITSGGLVSIGGVLSDTVSKLEVIDTNNLGITINAPTPRYNMYESDAAANEKWWDQLAIAGTLSFRAVNDAQSAASNWMTVDRSGTTIDAISFPNGKVGIGVYPSYLLHLAGSQTNNVGVMLNSITTAPGTNADMYGIINYARLNHVSGSTNYATGQYAALSLTVPTGATVVEANSIVGVAPANSGAGSVTNARTLVINAPTIGTACNIATWTENITVGSTYRTNTPPTNGALIQGNVGIGCTGTANALQVATSGAIDTGNYGKAIQTVRPTTSAVHLAFVRQGSWVWGLGNLYNSNTFAIFNSPSATDSSNTSAAFTIDTNSNVGIGTTAPGTKLQVTGDANILSNWKLAQLRIGGATNSNYQLNMGYDTTANEAVIQAGEDGTAYRNICLNPFGGNVGIGSTGPAAALQVATSGSSDITNYGKAIQTVRPTTSAVHLAFVRQGSYVWGLGTLYNSNTFAIFNSPSPTDSSNTSAAFTIDTSNNASFSGNVAISGTGTTIGGYVSVPRSCCGEVYQSGSTTQALILSGAKLTIFDSVGISNFTTPSSANDKITILVAGTYQCTFRSGVQFASLSGGIGILSLALQKNGSSISAGVQFISSDNTADTSMVVCQALVDCAVNDVITILGGSNPAQTITFASSYLSVTRVGSF